MSANLTTLRNAADIFTSKNDLTRASQCRSLADLLARHGSFKSDRQLNFARSLVEQASRGEHAYDWGREVPKFFDVLQRHSEFVAPVYAGDDRKLVGTLVIRRRNQDSLCWLMWNDCTVGKIDNARAVVWQGKASAAGVAPLKVLGILEEFEADPLGTAKRYGSASGRCCSCGRDLTHPASIAAGIGPVCAKRF